MVGHPSSYKARRLSQENKGDAVTDCNHIYEELPDGSKLCFECDHKIPAPVNIRLLGNTVLLEPLKGKERSDGGIWYNMPHRDDRKQWTVRAVGPGRRLADGTVVPPEVKVGERCLCNVGISNRYAFDDGRVIVEADQIEMVWR